MQVKVIRMKKRVLVLGLLLIAFLVKANDQDSEVKPFNLSVSGIVDNDQLIIAFKNNEKFDLLFHLNYLSGLVTLKSEESSEVVRDTLDGFSPHASSVKPKFIRLKKAQKLEVQIDLAYRFLTRKKGPDATPEEAFFKTQPLSMKGNAKIFFASDIFIADLKGRAYAVHYTGEIKVNLPFAVGKNTEQKMVILPKEFYIKKPDIPSHLLRHYREYSQAIKENNIETLSIIKTGSYFVIVK